jgi:hypothetical protein
MVFVVMPPPLGILLRIRYVTPAGRSPAAISRAGGEEDVRLACHARTAHARLYRPAPTLALIRNAPIILGLDPVEPEDGREGGTFSVPVARVGRITGTTDGEWNDTAVMSKCAVTSRYFPNFFV